jgi:hypothetical protein
MRVQAITMQDWVILEKDASITTPFHDPDWLNMVLNCLGGELDSYLCEGDGGCWLVPCFSKGPWGAAGFRIGGIGYGGPVPLADWPSASALATSCRNVIEAICYSRGQRCKAATVFPLLGWTVPREGELHPTSIIYPGQTPAEAFASAHGTKRTAVRKAIKLGLEVSALKVQNAAAAHALIAQTQVDVGASYTTPFSLIQAMLDHPSQMCKGYGVFLKGALASVALVLERGHDAFLLFHGWDRACATMNANELIYWELIRAAIDRNIRRIDLGRSHSATLLKSKERWGATSTPVLTFNNFWSEPR